MLNPVEQKNKLKPSYEEYCKMDYKERSKNSYFDHLNFELDKFDKYFINVDKNPKSNSIKVSYFSTKPKLRLNGLIDQEFIDNLFSASTYKCPFNEYIHSSLSPVAILSDNPMQYIEMKREPESVLPWWSDMACDPTFLKEDDEDVIVETYLTNVDQALLGPGYTDFFYPSDGSNYTDTIGIELENGDIVLFLIKKWYNK